MRFGIFHNGFLLYSTHDESMAWEKARLYGGWFTSIEIRSEGRESNFASQ